MRASIYNVLEACTTNDLTLNTSRVPSTAQILIPVVGMGSNRAKVQKVLHVQVQVLLSASSSIILQEQMS